MSRFEVDVALQRLVDVGLVALRPWRDGGDDGVWQLLPLRIGRSSRGRIAC